MTGDRFPRSTETRVVAAAATLGLGALAGLAAYSLLAPSRATQPGHRADDAPGRTAKKARFGDYAVTGKTVTINKPRAEIYAFVRDFANVSRFMENVEAVADAGDRQTWTIRAPLGRTVEIRTRIVNEREGEFFAWRTTEDSQIEGEGKFLLRDAPGGRGTLVESIVAYKPPLGEVGRLVAKLFQAEPSVQSRRDLKRLKMLLETGEIATSQNRKEAA
jgi:uncharacterized membrane protein